MSEYLNTVSKEKKKAAKAAEKEKAKLEKAK